MMNYDEIRQKLANEKQEHLLRYYDELDENSKKSLLHEIEQLDFQLIQTALQAEESIPTDRIEPLTVMRINDIEPRKEEFRNLGIEAIQNNCIGAVLLAGGQGTRLGFDKPKGMLDIGLTKTVYLFEVLIQNLMDVVKESGTWIHLYIMTSRKNNDDTVQFFDEQNYFGYSKEYIHFFIQEMAPAVDFNGKVFLEDKGKINLSPNGNGGWFTSLKKYGLLKQMKDVGIQWLNVFSVDNVLQRIADPVMIGATIAKNLSVATKVIKKVSPDERVGVVCRKDGKPSIIEYYELTDELRNCKDTNGEPAYNYGVTLNYLFEMNELENRSDLSLPVHLAKKAIPYIDENGTIVKSEEPNGYKLETLILDMIGMFDDVLAFEVDRALEFAPIKNKTGSDSVETARAMLQENHFKL